MSTKKTTILSLVLCCVCFALQGCIYDGYEGPEPNQATRTVLVYLGADDASLTKNLSQDVEKLRSGWTYTGNRCLIYVDAEDSKPLLLSLRGGCPTYPEPFVDTLAVYQEENSASPEVFARVIADVVEREPADSYGLIFISHASGWLPEGTLGNPTKSLGSDLDAGDESSASTQMELSDFAAAIPNGQFDFVIFEACLMSGVEVAYELSKKTDYILASTSELLQPGFAPIYKTSLRHLFDTKISVEQGLKAFANSYRDYINSQSGANCSAALSIIKTEKLEDLASKTGEVFSDRSLESISDITSLQYFDRPGSYGDSLRLPRFFDFMECMERIASADQYQSLESLMSEIVVWKSSTPYFMLGYNGFEIRRHCGLTTYIEQLEYEKLNLSYHDTSWWKTTHTQHSNTNSLQNTQQNTQF